MVLSVSGLVTVTATLNSLINALHEETKQRELIESLKRLDEAVANDKSAFDAAAAAEEANSGNGSDDDDVLVADGGGVGVMSVVARGRWRVLRWLRAAPLPESLLPIEWLGRVAGGVAGVAKGVYNWLQPAREVLGWGVANLGPLLGALAAGACVGTWVEGWPLFDSIYFSLISILTVGYGDFSPSSTTGRLICTLFLPLACGAAVASISSMSSAVVQLQERLASSATTLDTQIRRMEVLLERQSESSARANVITETDYMCATLLELELVDAQTIAKVRAQFYRLDKSGNGYLSRDDYTLMKSIQLSNARARWRHAVNLATGAQRVMNAVAALRVLKVVAQAPASGSTQARTGAATQLLTGAATQL